MSTIGQFSAKSPTIKRILKEASELSNSPSPDYTAAPIESNLFEWHFTIRGPPSPSPFAGGLYHGRIILPPAYPLRPPSFRFLTPSGRFEVNREICLSISGFHEETWQAAWGIRTALIAIRAFMDTDAKGQMGGLEQPEETRRRLARESGGWKCSCTGKTCAEMIAEAEEASRVAGRVCVEEKVPDELRLGYREDIEKPAAASSSAGSASASASASASGSAAESAAGASAPRARTVPAATPTRTTPATTPARPPQQFSLQLIDVAIAVVGFLFLYYAIRYVC